MNKSDLVDFIAGATDTSKVVAGRLLEAVLEGITSALAKGEPVTLTGFGTFKVNERSARVGRNPKTGELIDIKASKIPGFKAGANLKQVIQGAK